MSSLLIETPKTIKTVKQLLHSDVVCSIDEVAYIRDHIDRYNEDSVNKINNKIKAQPVPFVRLEKGVELIKEGGNAIFTDGNHVYPILKGNRMS